MNVLLIRDYRDPNVTLGTLNIGTLKWQTLERPWVPSPLGLCGTKGVSCVPVGTYKLVPYNSEGHPKVWCLINPKLSVYMWESDVPAGCPLARTTCLIHSANFASELRGCIAVGKSRAKNGTWSIQRSRDALNEVRNALNGAYDNSLTISELPNCLPASIPPAEELVA